MAVKKKVNRGMASAFQNVKKSGGRAGTLDAFTNKMRKQTKKKSTFKKAPK